MLGDMGFCHPLSLGTNIYWMSMRQHYVVYIYTYDLIQENQCKTSLQGR